MRLRKIKLYAERALDAQNPLSHRCSWRLGVLASAIALLGSLAAVPVHALGLGRVTVQSVLGEALRAEIEVPEITADEAATLRVGVASADAFKAAGLEYTAAVVGIQVSLQKRADGRSFLRLSSSRPVTEPFVDLILEANWASGRVVRDYTMLFDPPNLRQATAPMAAPTAPVLSRPATPPASAAANKPSFPSSPPPAQADVRQPAAAPVSASNGQKVTVKPGDTAGKIATQNKPASISLNQMLVALLRSNPDAFIGGNVNRLKSGALLDIPSSEEAGTVSTSEATSTIIAQAKDFNDFRQKLAAGVQTTQADIANRKTGGKVQAKVEDRAAVATKPDKLTLSKGAIQSKSAAEDKIAKDKQAKDASSRVAELTKNIGDLNKIAGGPATSPAAGAAPASASKPLAVPGVQIAAGPSIAAVPAPASPVIAAAPTAVVGTASVAALATASSATLTPTAVVPPVVVASAPVVAAPVASAPVAVKKPVVLPPPSPPEPSLIDELTINPLVLPGLGLLLALLAGFGFYRYKKRNDELSVDSSFLETRLQPDSFFGASGGQRIDTSDGGRATGSSPVYSPSQPDAADDVDPVAEADVYLAYGRDLQAEEILKEALRTSPTRVAIHAKLSEIYATRRDLQGFEVIAADAFRLARGTGPEWAYICELGRDLDLTNPMYRPSGQPQQGSAEQNMAASLSVAATAQQVLASSPTAAASSVNFDLGVSINDKPVPTTAVEPMKRPDFTPTPTAPVAPTHEPDPEPTVALQTKREPAFGKPGMDSGSGKTMPVSLAAAADSGLLEFDMGSLSLDLNGPITESPALAKGLAVAVPAAPQGPLETKFALAEEFRALGDSDGARSLASEVFAQADGALKSKAQAFLNALS